MAKIDAADVQLLVLDVDGVLTDGHIIYDDQGRELKFFCVQDGAGLKYWHRAGRRSAVITGRESPIVARRAEELGLAAVRQKALNKLPALREVLAELDVPAERTAYVGDDLPDIPPMRECGLRFAVDNAVDEVKRVADCVIPRRGGNGAVRWVIEKLLRDAGLWQGILQRYE